MTDKGANHMDNELLVIYGDTEIRVPADTDLNTLQEAMAENFPELKRANMELDEGKVIFTPIAGTKGC